MNTLIEMRCVSKIYNPGKNEVRALDGISMKVYAGEFLSIVGHSGSGKSTLMNILGCLDTPTDGEYYLEGEPVARFSEKRLSGIRNASVGFIFQGFNLIPSLSAIENVELPLLYRGMRRDMRRRLAAEALGKVGLAARAYHRPAEMSGGQQQRVAIARAIAANPPIILADEPTGNLDTKSGGEVVSLLRELNRCGTTVIIITHDPGLAGKAQRTLLISDGKLVSVSLN